MAASTVTVTATMDYQDGQPFDGFLEFRLNAASKTDEILVGPRLGRQTAVFSNGIATVKAVPNVHLEEGTFYKVAIWRQTTSGNFASRQKILETAAIVPDSDCNLRDIISVAPTTPSAVDVMRTLLSQAETAAQSAVEVVESLAPMTEQEVSALVAEEA